jgi:phage-related minor tail protein
MNLPRTLRLRPAALLGSLSFAALLCVACDKGGSDVVTVQSPVKVNGDALNEKVDHAKAELAAQQKAFADESRAKLNALDAKLEELKAHANQKGDEAKRAADQALAQLNAQREEARAALTRAEGATREQWDALKSGANAAVAKAEAAYNATLEKLKTD